MSAPKREPCPEGLHPAVCVDVVELGVIQSQWGSKDTVELRWQVFPTDPDNPAESLRTESGRPFMIVQRFNASLHPKAGLYKLLTAWRGKKFTDAELQGFDLDNVLGAPCQLQVIHNHKEGQTYANIQAIVPLGRGMDKPVAEEYQRVKDREDQQGNGHEPAADDDSDLPF